MSAMHVMSAGGRRVGVHANLASSASPPRRCGLSLVEVLIALGIISLFLIPSAMLYRRYREGLILTSAVERVRSACELARTYAINERREFSVTVADGRLAVFRGEERVEKQYRLPETVEVAAVTRGFNPAVFQPDGTAKEAGHLVLKDTVTKEEKKLVLHNLTGACTLE